MNKPAIVAIGYNRPDCMQRLLNSLAAARYPYEDITLIVSIDRSDCYEKVEDVANGFDWRFGKKVIRTFPERQGLKNHIIQCGDLTEEYDSVIVLEDDIYVAPDFYRYACAALDYYESEASVVGPALYAFQKNPYTKFSFFPVYNGYDNYFAQFVITWGQCWKKDVWRRFKAWLETHGELPSFDPRLPKEVLSWTRAWSKFFVSFMVENDLYYAVPYESLSTNFSEKGEHQSRDAYETAYQVPLSLAEKRYTFAPFEKGVKYDAFMERVFPAGKTISGVPAADILIDLYGTREKNTGKKYLITPKEYNFERVGSFGLRMHPIDLNVELEVPGDGINFYKVDGGEVLIKEADRKPGYYPLEKNRGKYETWGMNWRQLASTAGRLLLEGVQAKIRR